MKKIIVFLMCLLPLKNFAQNRGIEKHEQIEAAKIGLITNKLNLTTEQAPQFWAVYNEFDNKRKLIRKDATKFIEDAAPLTASDEQILQAIKESQVAREKSLALDREYMSKFLKVISVKQYAELVRTDRNFKQYLLKRLNERRN